MVLLYLNLKIVIVVEQLVDIERPCYKTEEQAFANEPIDSIFEFPVGGKQSKKHSLKRYERFNKTFFLSL